MNQILKKLISRAAWKKSAPESEALEQATRAMQARVAEWQLKAEVRRAT